MRECPDTGKGNCNFLDADVPENQRPVIMHLLQWNAVPFAQKDSELSHTDTVKMKIDTGDYPPISQRPYKVQLNNRKVIDNAIDEMLQAKIIEHSTSPWSFP